MSTVNISHLGSEAEVQLAEALVAVSEAVVAAAAEGDDTPRVVAVEETTHSEEDTVMQQVCILILISRNSAVFYSKSANLIGFQCCLFAE